MAALVRAEEAKRHPNYYLDGYPDLLMDDEVAIVPEADFKSLSEYSTSIPTGVCDGKVWKRNLSFAGGKGWTLLFYEQDPDDPGQCFIRQRRLIIMHSPEFYDWLIPGFWQAA